MSRFPLLRSMRYATAVTLLVATGLSVSAAVYAAAATAPLAATVRGSANPPALVWSEPESLVLVEDWARSPHARTISGDGWIPVTPGQLLFVAVERGDWVEVDSSAKGATLQLGFAEGTAAPADTVTWQNPGQTRLYIPHWSSASHVAVRSSMPTVLRLQLSARASSAVDWFLLDRQVGAWARTGGTLPEPPSADARRLLSALAALRAALPDAERTDAAPILLELWLELSARTRPLSMPFVKPVELETATTETVLVGPSRRTVRGPPTDVHRWQLRAKGPARILIRENGAIARVVDWSGRGDAPDEWTPIQSIRTVPRADATAIDIEVVEGTVALSLTAHAVRPEYREFLGEPRRRRAVLWKSAEARLKRWLLRAAAFDDTPDPGATAERTAHGPAAPVHAQGSIAQSSAAPVHAQGSAAPVHAQGSVTQSPAAPASAFDVFLLYARSIRAFSRDSALDYAWRGLRDSSDAAWQALFAERLLDLAIDGNSLTQRRQALRAAHLQAPSAHGPSDSIDRASIFREVLEASLSPPRLSRRPALGESVERWARALPDDPVVQRLANQYWTSLPYRALSPRVGTPTTAHRIALERKGLCRPVEDGIEAWLIPSQAETEFALDLAPGIYAVATLRPLDDSAQAEGSVLIDAKPITIHAAAGLSSRLAFASGRHRITRSGSTPAFALEATDGMTLPCEQLWRWQRSALVRPHQPVVFGLPSPGSSSVARVHFDPSPRGHRTVLTLGVRRFEVTTRAAASGAVHLAVEPTDEELTISADEELSVSVAMRREPDAALEPVSVALASLRAAEPPPPNAPNAAISAELLDELTELGQRLRSERLEGSRSELRRRRASLLMRAGYSALALRDIEFLPTTTSSNDLYRIEGASASVIPVGHVTTIGPLALPEDRRGLKLRRRALSEQGPAFCAVDLDRLDRSGVNAETLLAAFCAEKSGLAAAASSLYERIARSERHGSLLLHAATLLADSAVSAEDKQLSLAAARLGAWASSFGADPGALRARLARAIDWVVPSVLEGAAGVTWLAHGLAASPSVRQRILASLVGAPKRALLVEDGQQAELIVNAPMPKPIVVVSDCDASRETAACGLEAWLDGNRIDCAAAERARTCRIALPAGKHRLRFGFQGQGALGWVMTELGSESLAPVIATPWSVLDANTSAKLVLRGPTVLRLRARGNGIDGESITLNGCGLERNYASFTLPTGTDPEARNWPAALFARPIGLELDRSIPIDVARNCQLTISARQPHTLLQIAIARPVDLPTPRLVAPNRVPSTEPASVTSEPRSSAEWPRSEPRSRLVRPPLLAGIRSRFVSESLSALSETDQSSSEGAFQDVFGELSAIVSRELVRNRWWGTLQTGARLRNGPTTEFARIALDLPPQVGLAGVDLIGSVYSQSFDEQRTTTYSMTGRISRIWRISPDVAFLPQVGFTTLRLGTAPAASGGVDGDVFSNFYATHPRYVSAATALALRPFVDGLVNFSLSARSLPKLDGIDRATATVELLALPVANWPWLTGVDWMSSYRPASSLRMDGFVRHDLGLSWGLWHWITPSERIRWFGRVDFFFDAPAAKLGSLIVAPTIGLEVTTSGDRGLRDLSPQQAPLKEFQELGSARVRSGRVGSLEEPLAAETSGGTP